MRVLLDRDVIVIDDLLGVQIQIDLGCLFGWAFQDQIADLLLHAQLLYC